MTDTKARCWLWFHDWALWSPMRVNSRGEGAQYRRCNRCGKEQVRWM